MTSFRILHVTDLHCSTARGGEGEPPRPTWLKRIQIRARTIGGFDLVICSGDLGDHGNVIDLEAGFRYMAKLRSSAAPDDSAVPLIITPGNHDVQWPSLSDDSGEITPEYRYGPFIEGCNSLGANVHRPPLLGNESTELGPHWYYWNKDANIFVLPLSSVLGSGTNLADKPSQSALHRLSSIKGNGKEIAKRIQRFVMADIPEVDITQKDAFNHLIQGFPAADRKQFNEAIKIAVVHHPLFPVHGEAEQSVRAFDTTTNGIEIMEWLCEMKFHLVLYGHKHKMGHSISHGSWAHYGDVCELREIVTAVGGSLITDSGAISKEIGVQEIEITPKSPTAASHRSVALTRLQFGAGVSTPPKSHDLMDIAPNGELLWLHTTDGEKSVAALPRSHRLAKEFGETVRIVQQRFRDRSADKDSNRYIGDATNYLLEKLRETREYARGDRGVNRKFVQQIEDAARTAQTIIFVDQAGDETWLQPDLMEHLCLLFKIFAERNNDLIAKAVVREREWRHREPIEAIWSKIRSEPDSPCNSGLVAPLAPKASGAKPLNFDMMRVLVWNRSSLNSHAAQILKRLHCVFGVPLVWVDPLELEAKGLSELKHNDFHLIWTGTADSREAPTSFDPNDGNQLSPDDGWYLLGSERVPIPKGLLSRWWMELRCLLADNRAKGPGPSVTTMSNFGTRAV